MSNMKGIFLFVLVFVGVWLALFYATGGDTGSFYWTVAAPGTIFIVTMISLLAAVVVVLFT